jgi:hypothetical protein
MELELTELQEHVDLQIEARLKSICFNEWLKANPNYLGHKKPNPVTYPVIVTNLLELRQELYAGRDPEEISSIICNGEYQYEFLKSKTH